MTPREALYHIILTLGPVPATNRDDNLTPQEVKLRDSVRTLQNFITYHDDSARPVPNMKVNWVDEAQPVQRTATRGDGKDRLDTWKKELPPSLSREDFIE